MSNHVAIRHIQSNEIPQEKSDNVLLMLTDYSKETRFGQKLLELALSKYKKVLYGHKVEGIFSMFLIAFC
jgi:hypothetical protein